MLVFSAHPLDFLCFLSVNPSWIEKLDSRTIQVMSAVNNTSISAF